MTVRVVRNQGGGGLESVVKKLRDAADRSPVNSREGGRGEKRLRIRKQRCGGAGCNEVGADVAGLH